MRFANHLWAFWKARCKQVYEGKQINGRQVNFLANSYTFLADLSTHFDQEFHRVVQQGCNWGRCIPERGNICRMDGSYFDQGRSGWAYTLSLGDHLLQFGAFAGTASSPLHAEVNAMLVSLRAAMMVGWSSARFFTDCQLLVKVINDLLLPESLDWRVYSDLLDVIVIFKGKEGFTCFYVPRDLVLQEHYLANYARMHNISTVQHSYPSFPPI
ncbi:hypothetical protein LUZ62_060428 [Rhynchospora pubera]|uniref:RNase H type-1 domain-containing protein n=1 Tax=Rhynchospora pubera TaxID=906938 RepID=A0AAV8EDF5_9POAL|nr:hypothetical protein LUZ62_060428 [Rhynchospora pubera]